MRIIFSILFYLVFLQIPNAFSDPRSNEVLLRDWSGYYAGLSFGGQFGNSIIKTGSFGYNADNDKWKYHQSGIIAGAGLGHSYIWDHFVIGPEVEIGYLNLKGQGAQSVSPGPDTIGKSSSNFFTMLKGRLGLDLNHDQVFVTGGAIGSNFTKQVEDNCNIAPCGGGTINAKKSSFDWGYAIGGGVERFVEKNWSLKLEGLYFNLNRQTFRGVTNLGTTYDWSNKTFGYIIRAGINFHI